MFSYRIRPLVCKRQNQSGTKTFRIHRESGTISSSVNLVSREQRNLRMLCFVLGKFWKESKMSIVYGGKGESSGPRIICL